VPDRNFSFIRRTLKTIVGCAPVGRAFLAAVLLCLSANAGAQSQSVAAPPPLSSAVGVPEDSVHIFLLTMGQGDELWELFGHNAIWVHDPAEPVDMVYNWGVFDPSHLVSFVLRFLKGDMRYIMLGESFGQTVAMYKTWNRQVWAQELLLTPGEEQDLIAFLHWNALPENREYSYDYYRDNCSTRTRDAIDRVVGGALRAELKKIPTTSTYRSHSLRLMQNDPLVYGVDLLLGRPTDFRLTADQASFLPVQLMQYLRTVKLGGVRPLVGDEFVVNQATRPGEPTEPPTFWPLYLTVGLVTCAAILALAFGPFGRGGRISAAVLILVVAAILGIIGLIITGLVTVTDHVAAHNNENMFMLNPLWLVVSVATARLMIGGRGAKFARWTAILAAAIGIMAVLIHVVGLSRQPNWGVIGLLLPAELAIAWTTFRFGAHPPRKTA
jgi:hypothetical protein